MPSVRPDVWDDEWDDARDEDEPPPRPSPYSVEGYLLGFDDFAAGAVRATGWRRRFAVITAWAVLLPLSASVLVGIARLVGLLLFR
jgi:hypothetical protein